jgi:hypothetical protein
MVNEKYYGAGIPFWGWRCVLCGEIIDDIIWENRNHSRKRAHSGNPGSPGEIGEGR